MAEMGVNLSKEEPKRDRIVSLDVLRGLDMLFIIGLDTLVYQLARLYPDNRAWQTIREQMGHSAWEGMTLYDTIFPLFVFMAGMSMSFSLRWQQNSGKTRGRMMVKIWKRALILIFLGWIINGPLVWDAGQMRYASVLGLIGISGALAGSWVIVSKSNLTGILAGAVLILTVIGVLHATGGDMTPAGCFNSKVDTLLCPGILHNVYYDPEGVLCILSASALSLLGYAGGALLTRHDINAMKRSLILILSGGIMVILGGKLTIIKGIWTPGFVLSCGGIGSLLIGVLHPLVDTWEMRRWCYPLVVVGRNALFIYMITHLFNIQALAERLCSGMFLATLPPEYLSAGYAGAALLLAWLLCLFMYRRGIFIRL